MKKTLPTLVAMLLFALVTQHSFASNENSLPYRRNIYKDPKDVPGQCYVQMKDGTIRHFNSLKLVTGVFIAPHLLADNGVKIYPAEIIAYQSKEYYAVSQVMFAGGRKSFVATETLPGFAIRIAEGKLNIYAKKFNNGAKCAEEYFLQWGNLGKIYAYTPELMNDILKENPEAANYFKNKKNKVSLSKKLQATATLYNNRETMVSKN